MVYFPFKFQFFPLLWTASAKLLKKSQFPSFWWVSLPFSCSYSALGRSIWDNCWKSCNFHAFPTAGKSHFYDFIALRGPNPVSFVHCQGFLRNLSMSLQCHYTQTDGIWLIFSAIFTVFLCFGRLLLKCWKSCHFHTFPTAAKHHFYDFIALRGPNPVFFRPLPSGIWACHYIQTDGIWLSFSAIFKVFLCVGRLLPNCWKSCSFHPFNGFCCRFLIFPLLWDAPSGTTAEKVAISMLFPLQQSITFMIPVSFVHCQGFLRNLSMSLHTNRWHMADFLCNFQSFPLLWAASAISILSMGFSEIF